MYVLQYSTVLYDMVEIPNNCKYFHRRKMRITCSKLTGSDDGTESEGDTDTADTFDGAGADTDTDTDTGSRRKKRSTQGPVSNHEFARSNSASSLLGLSIQLHVNKDEYRTDIGSYYTINEYFGFKVK